MAVNDPLAPQARKAPLSAEEAEQFASMIRPSWELIDPEALAAGAAVAGAPPSGADTLVEPMPAAAIESRVEAAEDAPIKPMPIKAIGESLEPGQPLKLPATAAPEKAVDPPRPAAAAPPFQPGKTRLGVGNDEEAAVDSDALAPYRPTIAEAPAAIRQKAHLATPAAAPEVRPDPPAAPWDKDLALRFVDPRDQELSAQPVSALLGDAPPAPSVPARSDDARPTSSSPATTRREPSSPALNEPSATPPVYEDSTDEIELPIAGAPKGLALKLGLAAAAVIGLVVIGKLVLSPSDKPAPPPTATVAATSPQAAAPPPPPPPPVETSAPAATATAAPEPTPSALASTTAPSAAATAQPTVAPAPPPKPEPQAAAPKPPPPAATPKPEAPAAPPKKPPAPPPTGGAPKPGGGGIIRETPF